MDPNLTNSSYVITLDSHQTMVVFGTIIAAIASVAWPIIQTIRKFSSDKNAALKKNEAEITLYNQLKEQLETYKKSLDEARNENQHLWEIIRDLENRLKKVEHIESEIEILQKKLEEKDVALSRKDSEIFQLSAQLKEKEEKIRDLEKRVAYLESFYPQQ